MQPEATPEGDTPADPIAALEARLRDEFQAKLAGVTSKYNGELAALRKATKGAEPAPAPAAESPQMSAEEAFAVARRIARAEVKLPDAQRSRIEEMAAGKPLKQQVELYELAAMFSGESPPKETQGPGAQPQPGRDVRANVNGTRAQAPAPRSPDAFPATRAEWMAIVKNPDKTLMRKYQPAILRGEFDPDALT